MCVWVWKRDYSNLSSEWKINSFICEFCQLLKCDKMWVIKTITINIKKAHYLSLENYFGSGDSGVFIYFLILIEYYLLLKSFMCHKNNSWNSR